VPEGVLRPGRNVIALRIFDQIGEGGFLDAPSSLFLESGAGARIPLAGDWQYRVEREVPLAPGNVWADYPRPPRVLRPQDRPSALYNAMIAPLTGYGVRGVIWYQGESNAAQHQLYAARFGALIADWRRRLPSQGEALPFLFVQLASFRESEAWAYLREAQCQALRLPDTGMVVTLDIGDPNDIHPRNKREVGRRLSRLALANTYGIDVGAVRGPVPSAVHFERGAARVDYAGQAPLVTVDGGEQVLGFELEAADGTRHPASARLLGEQVQLTAPFAEEPRRVYYAFQDAPDVNLTNTAGLPAEPFRWPADAAQ
jgi:sialate O-acetylesterase